MQVGRKTSFSPNQQNFYMVNVSSGFIDTTNAAPQENFLPIVSEKVRVGDHCKFFVTHAFLDPRSKSLFASDGLTKWLIVSASEPKFDKKKN